MTSDLGIGQGSSERLTAFLAFWCVSALAFFVLAVATLVAVEHGHRLAAFLLLLSGGCFVAARLVHRARRGRSQAPG